MEMSNTSQNLQIIREDINNWKPNVAEVDLLAESLSKTADAIAEDLTVEDFNNLHTIIEQVNCNYKNVFNKHEYSA